MGKKNIRDNVGHKICEQFHNASLDNFFPNILEYCREVGKKDCMVKDARKSFLDSFPGINEALRKSIEETIVDAYMQPLIALGFVLGQKFDLQDPEAKRDMAEIWTYLKKTDWFFVYPRERRSEGG